VLLTKQTHAVKSLKKCRTNIHKFFCFLLLGGILYYKGWCVYFHTQQEEGANAISFPDTEKVQANVGINLRSKLDSSLPIIS